jgi:hypothetical protein
MNEEIEEYYEELYRLYIDENQPLERRYRQLRESLERVVREKIQGNSLQTTDLAARINYVATQYGLDLKEQNQLHTFRLTSNDILNHRKSPVKEEFLCDLRAVAYAYRKMFAQDIPLKLFSVLPKQEIASSGKKEKMEYIRRIRVCFDYADDTYLYVHPVDVTADEPIRVVYNKPGINHEFEETIKELWRYAQLNLLDVSVDRDGIYTPSFIVLEPDYLIDISSLAECYKDYGSHPANYFLSRLVPIDNARPLLLGNIANLFLDEWIHAGEEEPDYIDCMKKAFRQYPIELAACAELRDPSKEKEFAKDCRMHFEHIRDVVQHTFLEPGYNLDKKEAVLEPSYICEALGIQGRLDYMQRDMSSFIEMKSGKADEFSMQGKVEPKENNKVQMLLYMAVLEYSMGQDRRRMHPYLLYTRYPLLYPARASWAQVRRVINLRNRIVAAEYGVQFHNHPDFTRNLLAQINPEVVNERKLSGRFWEQYLKPSISRFREKLSALEPLEQAYFYTLYNFITKELYTSKSGDVDYEGRAGASALWLSTLDEKREAGEILYDLQIMENRASQAHKAYILLSIPQYDEMFLPNFRTGDVVVLYERNNDLDNATNKMVFKGNIEQITDTELRIRLRATQRNASVFSPDSRYAVEHDTEVVNERKLSGRFWEQYLKPSISRFREKLSALEPLEQAYFYTLYNFITKELYTSKSGDVDYEGRAGASALWLSTLDEKREAGEILYDLQIMENRASQAHKAYILLSIPQYDEMFLPNFRTGDVVVLYERNNDLDNATNKMVFKGNIEQITDTELRIRLRATQRNASVFSPDSRYAVEHDTMDTTFRSMYLGLSAFLDANTERRELLLGQRPPRFDSSFDEAIALTGDDFERVALKAESARDYFLLVGPPGTGKTSRALRRMVEHFYAASSMQILLLAYTNRAVDEICQSLSSITPCIDYIRVGSELSCDVRFRGHLLENILAECNSRREVNIRMADCRVYVGTVASIAAKAELFKLKRFDVAIVDEATQILEPQLLGILCAKFADERNAVGKFILIGDHKQLPAVILQNSGHSEVHDEGLREAGLFNLKDSLFERLYRFHLKEESPKAIDMLCRQGRMHPGVAFFPNKAFYAGKLEALGLPHQLEHIEAPVRFIPSKQDLESVSGKTNRYEAQIVAGLAKEVYLAHEEEFDPNRTLGVITPYRSQIALIRKELQALAIPALSRISIDTVERYQGSERDVIIYSFCVNHLYQLRFLPNLTEEDGVQIDRKLNVALTRARKQLFITGVPEILSHNSIYQYLLKTIY